MIVLRANGRFCLFAYKYPPSCGASIGPQQAFWRTTRRRIFGEVMKEIPLSQGYVALVDDADYERVSQYKWTASPRKHGAVYANRRTSRATGEKCVYLHRFIMDAPDSKWVDHIDGNGLNCQRSNLRLATPSENGCNRGLQPNNRSGYKGVSWYTAYGKWQAMIKVHRKVKHLGYFATKEEAIAAYAAAAPMMHGEFARLK